MARLATTAAWIAFNAFAVVAGCSAAFSEGASSAIDAGDRADAPLAPLDGAIVDSVAPLDGGSPLPPTPASIFGASLSLWLDGSEASTISVDDAGRVDEWKDRSPKKEATYMFYPRYEDRAEVVADAVHGHAAVRMKVNPLGSGPILRFNSAYGSDDFTLMMIVSYVAKGRADLYLGDPELIANEDAGTKITASLFPRTLQTAKGGWNDGAFHVVTLRRVGGTVLALRVDGTEATLAIAPVNSGSAMNEIGARFTTGPEFIGAVDMIDGSIAEIVRAYAGATPAQLAELAAYVATKYGLAL